MMYLTVYKLQLAPSFSMGSLSENTMPVNQYFNTIVLTVKVTEYNLSSG